MKYIYENEREITTFDKYFGYIESIKKILPEQLYVFASNTKHYDLQSQESLHDSWISSLSVLTQYDNNSDKLININLELLGPYHDRIHKFLYKNVTSFQFKNFECNNRRQDDLLYFEIRCNEGILEHEILFDNGIELLIYCLDIEYSVTHIKNNNCK